MEQRLKSPHESLKIAQIRCIHIIEKLTQWCDVMGMFPMLLACHCGMTKITSAHRRDTKIAL
jgi:hypothetical protein